jgi:hypothetical protein
MMHTTKRPGGVQCSSVGRRAAGETLGVSPSHGEFSARDERARGFYYFLL